MTVSSYGFLDESGNFDFRPIAPSHLAVTGISVRQPFPWNPGLDDLKYELLESDLDNEHFHCSKDNNEVRGRVFDVLSHHLEGFHVDSVVMEKAKIPPEMRAVREFYRIALSSLLQSVLKLEPHTDADKVIIVTDRIPVNKKKKATEGAIQAALRETLPPDTKYRMHHHDSRSHYGLQVADYCCWAVQRQLRIGESTWSSRIQAAVRSEVDVYRDQQTRYY